MGKNTALYDNPTLNVRGWSGKNPLRLVIDLDLELNAGLNLFDGSIPTIIYNSRKSENKEHLIYHQVDPKDLVRGIFE